MHADVSGAREKRRQRADSSYQRVPVGQPQAWREKEPQEQCQQQAKEQTQQQVEEQNEQQERLADKSVRSVMKEERVRGAGDRR